MLHNTPTVRVLWPKLSITEWFVYRRRMACQVLTVNLNPEQITHAWRLATGVNSLAFHFNLWLHMITDKKYCKSEILCCLFEGKIDSECKWVILEVGGEKKGDFRFMKFDFFSQLIFSSYEELLNWWGTVWDNELI